MGKKNMQKDVVERKRAEKDGERKKADKTEARATVQIEKADEEDREGGNEEGDQVMKREPAASM